MIVRLAITFIINSTSKSPAAAQPAVRPRYDPFRATKHAMCFYFHFGTAQTHVCIVRALGWIGFLSSGPGKVSIIIVFCSTQLHTFYRLLYAYYNVV